MRINDIINIQYKVKTKLFYFLLFNNENWFSFLTRMLDFEYCLLCKFTELASQYGLKF